MSAFNTGGGLVIKFDECAFVSKLRFQNMTEIVNYLFDVNGYYEYALGKDILLCGMDSKNFYKVKKLFEARLNEIPANVNIYAGAKFFPDNGNYSGYYAINLPWFLDKVINDSA
jgi:hypothetical protein